MNQRDRIIDIAKSQLGYHEGYNNDTKYGDWYGLPNEPWCAMFISWCAYQSGISEDIIPKFAGCITGFNQMTAMGITTTEHIRPEKGDLIFFEWDGEKGDIDHVGIVTYVENDLVHTIEGNHSDCVDEYVYYLNSSCIVGYAKPKYKEDAPVPTPDNRVSEIQRTLNERYGLNIAVDNIYGSETNWALVYGLQTEMNMQFGCGIAVDGIFGDETYTHAIEIYPGASGNMTFIVRSALICLGYNLSVGYTYDEDMEKAVSKFQRENYLDVDFIVGQNTQWEMFA